MKKQGFTLIELLVVISIIALLLTILMPALTRVRDQARTVVCKSYLKQWGYITAMYTGNNNDSYPMGDITNWNTIWFGAFYDLIEGQNDFDFTCCSMATKPNMEPADIDRKYKKSPGSPTQAWVVRDTSPLTFWNHPELWGSFGWNAWACNPPREIEFQFGDRPTKYNWRKAYAKDAEKIPIMFDCTIEHEWFATAKLYDAGEVNPNYRGGGVFAERHLNREYVNVMCMDLSIYTVGLKGLFQFHWNRNYDPFQEPLETTMGWDPASDILDFPDDIR